MEQYILSLQPSFEKFLEWLTLEIVVKFVIIYFFVVWISLIVWVIKDISIRTNSILFQIFCVLIILVWTPFSIFIYLFIRPRKSLYERYFEDLEDNIDILNEIAEKRKNELKESFKRKKIPENLEDDKLKKKEVKLAKLVLEKNESQKTTTEKFIKEDLKKI